MAITLKQAAALLALALLAACNKPENAGPKTPQQPPDTTIGQVIILNEGNFGWGEAGVTQYNPVTNSVRQNVFAAANGRPLGNVLHSAMQWGSSLYLVVNNSDKIVRVDARTFQEQEVLTGLGSPRYIQRVGEVAYVTDLYAKAIHIIGFNPMRRLGQIKAGGWTEGMAWDSAGQRLFVAGLQPMGVPGQNGEAIYVINTATRQLADSIKLGKGADAVLRDHQGGLWTNYSSYNGGGPALVKIMNGQPATVLPLSQWAESIMLNRERDSVYYTQGRQLFRMPATGGQPTLVAQIPGQSIYHLGLDARRNELYLTDAKDYTQAGTVYRYSAVGQLLHQFNAGVIPKFGLITH